MRSNKPLSLLAIILSVISLFFGIIVISVGIGSVVPALNKISAPILCAGGFPLGAGGIAPFNVATTTEDSPIPEPSTGADSVDILDLEEALILRYAPNFEGEGGDPEKRFCHTVDENTDCFTVFGPFFD